MAAAVEPGGSWARLARTLPKISSNPSYRRVASVEASISVASKLPAAGTRNATVHSIVAEDE